VELVRDPFAGGSQGGTEETVALTKSLTLALDGRKDAAASAMLAEDVVLHDVIARRTRRGRPGYLAGHRATLGEAGHLVLDRHHAGPRWVVIEGAVHGRESTPEGAALEHGFADVHRVVDGAIVETWHYVNRRGRPHTPRVQP
jgi:ketosteroid isomerase-like protein